MQWTAGESNPDFLLARQVSSRWTSSPSKIHAEVRPGFEPGLPPYRGGVPPQHLQTQVTRTELNRRFLNVNQASSPLDHEVAPVAEARVELAKSSGSRPDRFAKVCVLGWETNQTTNKWQARESHPAVRAYEAPLDTGPPASKQRSK